ncbi:MAG TPA: ATPase, T2SS/T4P/T4SS family [Phycisphaerae bacterium]|nr:ATPase, T2SS/T4P/T4SS family [Phycisphaerae bacterium]
MGRPPRARTQGHVGASKAASAGAPDGQAVVALVDDLLDRALACGASDVHFEPVDGPETGLLVRVRLDGMLQDFETVPRSAADSVIGRLKVLAGLLTYRIDIPQEGALQLEAADGSGTHVTELRLATFPTIRGERAVVRVFAARAGVERIDELGFEPEQVARLRSAVEAPAGMIVLTGPAGTGKTTTLYALIRHVRDHFPGRSIITVEDPVEQRIDRVTQIQINPHGELNYEVCMRSLLRQDPQVLLIGEIRDARTATVAIEAALTGHLILTTMHSGDPAEAVLRLLEMGVPAYQVVSAVTLVCAQRLLRRVARPGGAGAGCGGEDSPTGDEGAGYRGRIACGHVVAIDDGLRGLILRHPTASELRSAMQAQQPDLPGAAGKLVADGVTDAEEVRRVLGRSG